jgi:glycerophosphoryl diester phosphodiesterase
LDIGYGYTHNGKTYPFRGKGVGKIRTLSEVLKRFSNKKLLIDNKNGNDLETAQLIVDTLSNVSRKTAEITIEEADKYSNTVRNGIVTDHIEVLGKYYRQLKLGENQ